MSCRRIWFLTIFLVCYLCPLRGEGTPVLRQVRISHHGTFSRVEFVLQEDTRYRIAAQQDPFTIVVEFPQLRHAPDQEVIQARGPLVEAVHLRATATAISAEIRLTQPGRVKRVLQLHTPRRIVVDVVPEQPGPATQVFPQTKPSAADVSPSQNTTTAIPGQGESRLLPERRSSFWNTIAALRYEGIRLGPVALYPAVTMAETYDDNIFLTATGAESDVITTIRPSIALGFPWRSARFRIGYKAEALLFAEHDNENTFNQAFSADLRLKSASGWRLRLHERYLDTHDPSSSEAESSTGDPRTPRTQNDVGFRLIYPWRTKTELDLAFLRTDHHYGRERDDALNHNIQMVSLTFFYHVWPKTSLLWGYRFMRTDFTDLEATELDKDNVAHTGFAGFQFDPTAKVAGSLRLGYTVESFDASTQSSGQALEDETAFTADISLRWTPRPKTVVSLMLQRDIEASSTEGASSIDSTRLGLSLRQRFGRRFSAKLSSGYGRDSFNGLEREDDLWQGQIVGRYVVRQGFNLAVGYEYARRNSSDPVFDYTVNRFWVGISVPEPFSKKPF